MAKGKMSTYERLQSGGMNRRQRKELERQLIKEDPELEIVHRNAAGIDIGNQSHFVAVPPGRDRQPVQEFGFWTRDLKRMADWLKQCGVETVAMQSTGVYWGPVQEVLEEAGIEVFLVNARGTKNLPGRKSDVQECQWLMKLHTYGLLRNSFRPPEQIRALRTVWRHREMLVRGAGRTVQQMQKALTKMNVQLANVVTDITGVTGMLILRAIVGGERNASRLAKFRDPRVHATEQEIADGLEGHWREDVLFELEQALEAYDFQQRQMGACDRKLEQYMAALPEREVESTPEPEIAVSQDAGRVKRRRAKARRKSKNQPTEFDLKAELRRTTGVDLTSIDGFNAMTALTVVSELGAELVTHFSTEQHFCSWLTLAPRREVSGGKLLKHDHQRGSNRVANALRMAAESLSKSQSYLGAKYRSLKGRLGPLKGTKAMARILACLVFRLLTHGHAWVDRGTEYFEHKRQDRELQSLANRAAKLGMQMVPLTTT